MESDGDFLITWTGVGATGSLTDAWAQRYAANGGTLGPNFLANTYTPGYQGLVSKLSAAADAKAA